MKKLSLLVALILVVTIGGVYATWSYGENSVNEVKWDLTPNLQSYVGGSTAEGSLKVLVEPMISVVDNKIGDTPVGDADNDAGDKIAELDVTGELVILFSPFTDYEGGALDLTYRFEVNNIPFTDTTGGNKDARNIFDVDTSIKNIDKSSATEITLGNYESLNSTHKTSLETKDVGKYLYVISDTDLESIIRLNGNFTLETLEEYHDFEEALEGVMFKVYINKANS